VSKDGPFRHQLNTFTENILSPGHDLVNTNSIREVQMHRKMVDVIYERSNNMMKYFCPSKLEWKK
jgi:hypothetical protein